MMRGYTLRCSRGQSWNRCVEITRKRTQPRAGALCQLLLFIHGRGCLEQWEAPQGEVFELRLDNLLALGVLCGRLGVMTSRASSTPKIN